MRRRVQQAAVALMLVCAGHSALADNYSEARGWLERMAQAMNQTSYQGTFVYVRGEDVETLRITHVKNENGVYERMYAVSGPHREVIRDPQGVRCVLAEGSGLDGAAMVSGALFPEFPVEELGELRERYMFTVGGNVRIAGHKGTRITIYPRDEFRYGYDLWLEVDTALLLRWVLYDSDRRTLAKLMFTELRIGDEVDARELKTATPDEQFVTLPIPVTGIPAGAAVSAPWRPEGMPPGFRLAARSHSNRPAPADSDHLVYSDGLASVSVYIEPAASGDRMKEGLSRIGTANAYSKITGSRQVTAIGEVPPITVETIGNAFAGLTRESE